MLKGFKQVIVAKTNELGKELIKANTYIPSNLAIKGEFVKIKNENWQIIKIL